MSYGWVGGWETYRKPGKFAYFLCSFLSTHPFPAPQQRVRTACSSSTLLAHIEKRESNSPTHPPTHPPTYSPEAGEVGLLLVLLL